MRISAEERKDQLIDATIELMRREGVQRLTVRGIADEAGANVATVSYCFDGKDDLLRHAVDHWIRQMVDVPAAASSGHEELRPTIKRIADAWWDELEKNPADFLAQIELVVWALREASGDAFARSIYSRYEAALGQVFQAAVDATGETIAWSAHELARTLIMLVDGASLQYLADPASSLHRERFERILDLVVTEATQEP